MTGECDLRVESRFKNAILYRALRSQFPGRGWGRDAASKIGVSYNLILDFLSLKECPYCVLRVGRLGRGGKYQIDATRPKESAQKIAGYFGYSVPELFPVSLYSLELPRVVVREFQSPEVLSLQHAARLAIAPPQVETAEEAERSEALKRALLSLSPREEKIIKLRFGLMDGEEHTLEEIGREFGLTGSRIREIEAKALRNLRHPSRSAKLRAFVEPRAHRVRQEQVEHE